MGQRLASVVVLSALAVACQHDPFAWQYTTVKPSAADLVGVYELDDDSIALLRYHGITPPASRLVLQRDGTFAIDDVPACWRAADTCSSAVERANGTWRVVQRDGWWVVRLGLLKMQDAAADYGMDAFVRGDSAPRLLHFPVGDPDQGDAIAFRQVGAAANR